MIGITTCGNIITMHGYNICNILNKKELKMKNRKKNKEQNPQEKQKEILLNILNIQNDGIESAIETVNTYLTEVYAHNISMMHILMKNLK